MNHSCEQLDDFLCGWLADDETAAFTEHLVGCDACRRAIELQERIDGSLVAYRESVRIPDSVRAMTVESRRNPVASGNQISTTAVSVLVAAAVLLGVGVGLHLVGLSDPGVNQVAETRVNDGPRAPRGAIEPERSPDEGNSPDVVAVAIETGPGSIALEVPTRSSRVSVFRVYNVVRPTSDQD